MFKPIPPRISALLSLLLVLSGLALLIWLLPRSPFLANGSAASAELSPTQAVAAATSLPTATPLPPATPTPLPPLVFGLADGLPAGLAQAVRQLVESDGELSLAPADAPNVTLRLDWQSGGQPVYTEVYALAARFDTVFPQAESSLVRDLWRGAAAERATWQRVVVLSDTLPALVSLLGEPGPGVQAVADREELLDLAWADRATLALLPFEHLTPELVAFAVDGENPIDNRFVLTSYPLAATVYAHASLGVDGQSALAALQNITGGANRDPSRLTVLAMTGVTAMVRQTAFQMDQYGPEWVAEVIGPELAAADITAISNEVPFVPGCVTNTAVDNLTFCSSPDYMAALDAVGVDIIGLTGNHQNDYGRADALTSLEIYAEAGLPVYGGGRNKAEAFAPLYLEHNGNRLAFLGANSFGPTFAWATDDGPGSAEFDLNILSATIRAIKEQDKADVVLVELQYQESYDVTPLWDQRQNFRLLSQTGADIVTGVQSHVPQAIEFEGGRMILYGLGNLFFDQMFRQDTREGLIVKHSFYAGRHISTQVLTTLIYDYGQPHWTSDAEREALLKRVYGASYWPRIVQQ